jgi:SAM-dependent methyltransferase
MAPRFVKYLYRVASQFFNPLRWPSTPREVALFAADARAFVTMARNEGLHTAIEWEPILFNRKLNSSFDTHYTYQAAWATRRIVERRPKEHVDVSSQVPFIAQLSAIVPVTMYEFRKPDIELMGLTLREASLLELPMADRSIDSLSCMHVIEHVGLGRYGDPLDPRGTERALCELCRVVAPGGVLYLSLPVGRERVVFNAHRVSDAEAIVARVAQEGLRLRAFALIDDRGRFHDPARPEDARGNDYSCGCFLFERPGEV